MMSTTLPQLTYQPGDDHLNAALQQEEFKVRMDENKVFRHLKWEKHTSVIDPWGMWKPAVLDNLCDLDNAPDMEYGWIQVTQLARLFGNKLPSWIRLSQDEDYRAELYRQILEKNGVSACNGAFCVYLAHVTLSSNLNRTKPLSWEKSKTSLKPRICDLHMRKRS